MRICLSVRRVKGTAEQGDPRHHFAFEQDEVLVGRDEAVEVRLPDPSVSFVHLRLLHKKGCLFAVDCGSTNGTRLDGRRLPPDEPVEVRPGARLALGPFELALGAPDRDRQPLTRAEDTAALAREMVLEVLGALGDRSPDQVLAELSSKAGLPDLSLPPVAAEPPATPPSASAALAPASDPLLPPRGSLGLRLVLVGAGVLLVAGVAALVYLLM